MPEAVPDARSKIFFAPRSDQFALVGRARVYEALPFLHTLAQISQRIDRCRPASSLVRRGYRIGRTCTRGLTQRFFGSPDVGLFCSFLRLRVRYAARLCGSQNPGIFFEPLPDDLEALAFRNSSSDLRPKSADLGDLGRRLSPTPLCEAATSLSSPFLLEFGSFLESKCSPQQRNATICNRRRQSKAIHNNLQQIATTETAEGGKER